MTCTWCGHPDHASACTRKVDVRIHDRLAGTTTEATIACPCSRRSS